MRILHQQVIELNENEARNVFEQHLNDICGDHFLKNDEVWVDHGGHGSGFQEPLNVKENPRKATFIRAALEFRAAMRKYNQTVGR